MVSSACTTLFIDNIGYSSEAWYTYSPSFNVASAYTILFVERPHFSDIIVFFISVTNFKKGRYNLKCNN